jgi:RHS repeat-associated protein
MTAFHKKVATLPLIIVYLFTVLLSGVPFSYAENSDEQVFYYLNDHLGGIEAVVDENGNVVERNDYLPFGSERPQSCPQPCPPPDPQPESYGYTGKEQDDESGLYYYGARYYDPKIGRFTQIDPLALGESEKPLSNVLSNPQELNGYTYVINNPLKYTDPTGKFLFIATVNPSAELPNNFYGMIYEPQTLSDLEKQVAITLGGLATFIPLAYEANNIISDISSIFAVSQNIKNGVSQQKNSIIKISPNELTPTDKIEPDRLQIVQRQIKNKGEFYKSHPIRYYENDGTKLIVEGHHRTQAAKNLDYKVWAKPVDASYFKQKWNATVDDFLQKAKDFVNKSVKNE